ncbi:MAG: SEC-C metal-binding domain-containing protein [Eubacteriales bacterium]|nr:SEC-C metal-binding domain-containing protein [Eubacteriales bacterium]
MSLYSEWLDRAKNFETEKDYQDFWTVYFDKETQNYKKILGDYKNVFEGTIKELSGTFDMDEQTFVGFLDGINTSLEGGEIDLESLTEDSNVSLKVDFEKLYFNMLNAKADWLFGLEQWDAILSNEKRAEILRQFRASKVFVSQTTVGRNDPCPCGSGKKYKKCCGK